MPATLSPRVSTDALGSLVGRDGSEPVPGSPSLRAARELITKMNPNPYEASLVNRDGVRAFSRPSERNKAHAATEKLCRNCRHWVKLHPEHGPCRNPNCARADKCAQFEDPEPGRPDVIFTREQIDRMHPWRYRLHKDRLYLLVDGRYGLLDRWTSPDWIAR